MEKIDEYNYTSFTKMKDITLDEAIYSRKDKRMEENLKWNTCEELWVQALQPRPW